MRSEVCKQRHLIHAMLGRATLTCMSRLLLQSWASMLEFSLAATRFGQRAVQRESVHLLKLATC